MAMFMLQRVVPPGFDVTDPDQRALHSRWAADAYMAAGIVWLGGITALDNMYSLVVADDEEQIHRYCAALGVTPETYELRPVVGLLGPHVALSKDDPRYRPRGRRP
jgi:hypothetical protein